MKTLEQWFEYLEDDERHNVLLLVNANKKDLSKKVNSIEDAIDCAGDWSTDVRVIKTKLSPGNYFIELYLKYKDMSEEDLKLMKLPLKSLIKDKLKKYDEIL